MIEKRIYRYGQKREPVDEAIWQLLWLLNRVLRPRGLPRLNVVSLHYDNEQTALVIVLDNRYYRMLRLQAKSGTFSLSLIKNPSATDDPQDSSTTQQTWDSLTEETLKLLLHKVFGINDQPSNQPSDTPYSILANLN